MKAKISPDQIQNLLTTLKGVECEFLIKKDEYFTSKGQDVSNFKEKIRIRKEVRYLPKPTFAFLPSFDDLQLLFNLEEGWEKFVNTEKKTEKTWLTFKKKVINNNTEINEESEGQLFVGTEEAFRQIMETVGCKVSFEKVKISFSWYSEGLHFELTRVLGIDSFYLEVESIGSGKTNTTTFVGKIHRVFANLGITEFETRGWKTLIKENKNKDKE